MALTPVSGRVAYPDGTANTSRPVPAGAVVYTRPAGGTDSLGAVTVAGRKAARITDGVAETVHLAPGEWIAEVHPTGEGPFSFPLAVEGDPVDLATAQPIIVNGQKFAKGDRGDPGPPGKDSTVPGPPNTLAKGTVTTAATADFTITGQAPQQILNLQLPIGPEPSVSWTGDRLTVGGKQGPSLTGPTSTVPGPTGKTAYQYAVDAGFKGTEEEFAQATVPDVVSWANLADKPVTFPPAAHTHTVDDVTNLQAALSDKASAADPRFTDARTPLAHTHTVDDVTGLDARLTALDRDTGWVEPPLTFVSGWRVHNEAYVAGWAPLQVKRYGSWLMLNGTVSKTDSSSFPPGTTIATLNAGYRPAWQYEDTKIKVTVEGYIVLLPAASGAFALCAQIFLG